MSRLLFELLILIAGIAIGWFLSIAYVSWIATRRVNKMLDEMRNTWRQQFNKLVDVLPDQFKKDNNIEKL